MRQDTTQPHGVSPGARTVENAADPGGRRGAESTRASSGADGRPRGHGRVDPASEASRVKRQRIALGAVSGVIALVVLGGVAEALASSGRIYPGVRVGDVAVGWLTPGQASTKLEKAFVSRFRDPVTVSWGSRSWKVQGEAIGATLDATSTVDRAYAVGRTGGLLHVAADRLGAIFGGVETRAEIESEPSKTARFLDRIDAAVARPAVDASVSVTGPDVTSTPSSDGRRVDRAATASAILAAFLTSTRRVAVSVETVVPAVTEAEVQQAVADARKLMAGSVTVAYKSHHRTFSRETVASLVAFRVEPVGGTTADAPGGSASPAPGAQAGVGSAAVSATGVASTLVACFDPARLGVLIAPLVKGMGTPARDASFLASGGSVSIRASRTGIGPDLEGLASELASACIGGGARRADVRLVTIQPTLTTADANAMGIKDRLGTFTTTFDPSNRPRVNNIDLLAGVLDDKLIAPGAVFSFNQAAGQRTAAKGYQEANAIVNGQARSAARRRSLPGRHDDVQRGVLRGSAHRRAREPLVLHLALPDGT